MSNLISKPGFTDKDTSILNEVAFAKGLYGLKDKDGNLDTTFIKNQRGKNLAEIFYTKDGWVNTEVVEYGSDLYYNLLSDSKYYKESLQKYTLVETTSTIAAKPGGYTDDSLLYQGEQTYHGFAVTDGIATGFVNRGTDGAIDLEQDVQMALYQSNPPYVQQSVEFMQNVYDQQGSPTLVDDGGYKIPSIAKDNVFATGFSLGKTGSDSQALYVLESGKNLMGNVSFEGYGTTEVLQRANPEAFATFESVLKSVTTNYVRANDAVPENFTATQFGNVVPITSGYGIVDGFTDLFNGVNLHGIKNYRFSAYDAEGNIIPDQLNTVMTQKYLSTLDTQANTINQQLQNLSTTDYAIEYSEYLADKANPLSFNKDNLFNQLDSIDTVKENFEKIFGGYNNYNGIDNIRYSVDNMVIDMLGGNPANQNIFQVLSKSISEQPNAEAKSQFIASLKDNLLIKNIMDSTFGIQSDDLLDIADNLADINRSSQQAQVFRGDPLTFDLDGDGIETLSVDEGVLFDHEAKDVREGTGWVSSDDGLLVRDLDGNGTIDSGRELFGDNTLKADGTKAAHGFEALAELDSNADGIFDVNDAEFENLQVWQDSNQDGISQANELKGLSEVGVSSIDLSHQSINRATDGGVISDISTFTKIDGATAEIGNLFLDKEPARSEFTDEVAISGEILSTGIDIRGIGAVRNLSQAASLNPDLANILSEVSANPVAGLQTESIVKEWSKSANFSDTLNLEKVVLEDGTSFTFNISEDTRSKLEQIQTLETFTGNKIIQTKVDGNQLTMTYGSVNMNYNIAVGQENVLSDNVFANGWNTVNRTRAINIDQITNGYNSIINSVDKSLFSQTIYPDLISQLEFNYDDVSGDISVDFTNFNEFLSDSVSEQLSNSMFLLEKVKNYTESILVESGWNYDDFFKQIVVDTIVPNISDIDLTVSQANEINRHNIEIGGRLLEVIGATNTSTTTSLYQGKYYIDEDKYILGKANNESIVLRSDRSIVEAGGGNDTIVGYGESIVKYNLGDGFDSLKLSSTSKILFGDGILQENLSFSRSNNGKNLIINVDNDPTQGVEVIDFYYLKRTPTIEFSDGSIIQGDSEVFNSPIIGTDSDDHVVLSNVYNDYVEVGKGDDSIGFGGNNDYTNDTFKYNLGDGFDTIGVGYNNSKVQNGDKILFGEVKEYLQRI